MDLENYFIEYFFKKDANNYVADNYVTVKMKALP